MCLLQRHCLCRIESQFVSGYNSSISFYRLRLSRLIRGDNNNMSALQLQKARAKGRAFKWVLPRTVYNNEELNALCHRLCCGSGDLVTVYRSPPLLAWYPVLRTIHNGQPSEEWLRTIPGDETSQISPHSSSISRLISLCPCSNKRSPLRTTSARWSLMFGLLDWMAAASGRIIPRDLQTGKLPIGEGVHVQLIIVKAAGKYDALTRSCFCVPG